MITVRITTIFYTAGRAEIDYDSPSIFTFVEKDEKPKISGPQDFSDPRKCNNLHDYNAQVPIEMEAWLIILVPDQPHCSQSAKPNEIKSHEFARSTPALTLALARGKTHPPYRRAVLIHAQNRQLQGPIAAPGTPGTGDSRHSERFLQLCDCSQISET